MSGYVIVKYFVDIIYMSGYECAMKNKAAVALGRLGGNRNTPKQLEKRRQNMAKATADRMAMRAANRAKAKGKA